MQLPSQQTPILTINVCWILVKRSILCRSVINPQISVTLMHGPGLNSGLWAAGDGGRSTMSPRSPWKSKMTPPSWKVNCTHKGRDLACWHQGYPLNPTQKEVCHVWQQPHNLMYTSASMTSVTTVAPDEPQGSADRITLGKSSCSHVEVMRHNPFFHQKGHFSPHFLFCCFF